MFFKFIESKSVRTFCRSVAKLHVALSRNFDFSPKVQRIVPSKWKFRLHNLQYHLLYITGTLCNKLYIGESGRKLGDRFREHLLDVKNKGKTYQNPWLDISTSRPIRTNTWKFAELTYTLETMKLEKELIFKLGTLAPNGINERFSFA